MKTFQILETVERIIHQWDKGGIIAPRDIHRLKQWAREERERLDRPLSKREAGKVEKWGKDE